MNKCPISEHNKKRFQKEKNTHPPAHLLDAVSRMSALALSSSHLMVSINEHTA